MLELAPFEKRMRKASATLFILQIDISIGPK